VRLSRTRRGDGKYYARTLKKGATELAAVVEKIGQARSQIIAVGLSTRLAEADKVRAEFKDGMLTVHVPKSEKAKAKQVEVKTS
jgi:hypothetical protein